ncbi:type II secretion system F family protein [Kordia sp. YSTF-M3]|uniref:General secretion pathway protein F n=1 Tax=Kordia aestuariivivens TaxID=2759037 RepID=A0ABR7QC38_9FLAO|nr:type II secretion system F family protein [Kordia aestuariivivens]MBC8756043.1 type II secretion system F family protein [Kordia aestuariivivens]
MKLDIKKHKVTATVTSKKVVKSKGFNFDFFTKFSNKDKEAFYREFAVLIKSGVDFNQSLQLLAAQQKSEKIKNILITINEDVVSGSTLFDALQKHNAFSPYEYYSIKIGEETRKLAEVLTQLQRFFARKIKMKRQIVSVMTYPAFVLGITFIVLYFMLNYIVPMFTSVFKQFGGELPAITKFVIRLSENFNTIMFIIVLVVITGTTFHKLNKNNNRYRDILGRIVLKIPFIGTFLKKIYVTQFCQSLSLLLSAKTPLIISLDLTKEMITFYPMQKAIQQLKLDILKGNTLSNSLEKHTIFPKKLVSLVGIGEKTNELDTMFSKLNDQYNDEIEHTTKMIGTILEPLIIIIIGGLVGFILISMYTPMFDLSKVIG